MRMRAWGVAAALAMLTTDRLLLAEDLQPAGKPPPTPEQAKRARVHLITDKPPSPSQPRAQGEREKARRLRQLAKTTGRVL